MLDDDEKKIKIIYFVDRLLRGGIQTFIYNHLLHIDRKKFNIDLLVLDDGEKYEMEDELKVFGIKIYKLTGIWPNTIQGYMSYVVASNNFFRKHNKYDILHIHSSSKALPIAFFAKKYGIPHIIGHSHTVDFQTGNLFKKVMGGILKVPFRKVCNEYMACSKEAAKWLFGDNSLKNVHYIKNGIDINQYEFDSCKREEMREKYNIGNQFVVGHVGRFAEQKNHKFLIEIFKEIKNEKTDALLILIGEGELEDEIRCQVDDLALNNSVLFLGFREDVYNYMQMMDCFLFPSLCEGLGIALIEAQANGLYCYTTAEYVPKDVDITDNIVHISLETSAEEWARMVLRSAGRKRDIDLQVRESSYNIFKSVIKLEETYVEIAKGK